MALDTEVSAARRRRTLTMGFGGAAACVVLAGASWVGAGILDGDDGPITTRDGSAPSVAGDTAHRGDSTAPLTKPTVADPVATPAVADDGAAPEATAADQPEARGAPLTLVFGGDVHLDGPLATTLAQNPTALFDGLQPALSDADVAVINLETAVTTGGTPAAKQFTFRTPPSIFAALRDAGVDVIAGANNHTIDYGPAGFVDTLTAATENQAPLIGLGMDEAAAFAPYRAEVRGRSVSVINATDVLDGQFVASWTATPTKAGVASAKNTERLLAEVRTAREASDTVVVFLHWGVEATTCPSARQESLAVQLRDAGADVIVGSHAHRVLSGGYLGPAYVHYGLGNLVFKTSSAEGRRTGLLRLVVDDRTVTESSWLPAQIGPDFTPSLLEGAKADEELRIFTERRSCTSLSALPST